MEHMESSLVISLRNLIHIVDNCFIIDFECKINGTHGGVFSKPLPKYLKLLQLKQINGVVQTGSAHKNGRGFFDTGVNQNESGTHECCWVESMHLAYHNT